MATIHQLTHQVHGHDTVRLLRCHRPGEIRVQTILGTLKHAHDDELFPPGSTLTLKEHLCILTPIPPVRPPS